MPTNEEKAILLAHEMASKMITERMAELDNLITRSRKEKEFLKDLVALLEANPQAREKDIAKGKLCLNCGKEDNPSDATRCIDCGASLKK